MVLNITLFHFQWLFLSVLGFNELVLLHLNVMVCIWFSKNFFVLNCMKRFIFLHMHVIVVVILNLLHSLNIASIYTSRFSVIDSVFTNMCNIKLLLGTKLSLIWNSVLIMVLCYALRKLNWEIEVSWRFLMKLMPFINLVLKYDKGFNDFTLYHWFYCVFQNKFWNIHSCGTSIR